MKLNARCYVRHVDGLWVAMCVDLDLSVQGASEVEVVDKLKEQIVFYVEDALTEEPEICRQLLSRKAPLIERARFRWGSFWNSIAPISNTVVSFIQPTSASVTS